MFDLNREIAQWRSAISRTGSFLPDELDELESHLLDACESLVRNGVVQQDAFIEAIKQMGDPMEIGSEFDKVRAVSSKRLWRAFRVAPVVAPVVFAVFVFVAGLLFTDPKDPGTPIGVIAIPVLSLTLGVVASYLVAGVFGMPIVFFLRNRGWLNGRGIHATAFLLAIVFCTLLEVTIYYVTTPPRPDLIEFLRPTLYIACTIIPCIMLSATMFWWMVRDNKPQSC